MLKYCITALSKTHQQFATVPLFKRLVHVMARVILLTPSITIQSFVVNQLYKLWHLENLSQFRYKKFSYHRETVLQGALVLAKIGRIGQKDNILQKSSTTVT